MTQNSSAGPEAAAGAVRPGAWLWAGLALLLAGWTFFPILIHGGPGHPMALVQHWLYDDNYSYGFLIPPLALYFVWERWEELRGLPAEGSAWGLAVLALAFLVFAAGTLGGVLVLPRASAIVLLLGAILWIGGWRWTRELLFPVLFLFLMLPIPNVILNQIAFPLQLFAAEVAEETLFLLEVPVRRMGNVMYLPHTQLEVAQACSGLRSLLALTTTGVVFAYFFGRTWLQRGLIVAVSIPIAILVNAARVAITGLLAHRYGMEVATGFFHTLEGFGMFALAFTLMAVTGFAIVRLLPDPRTADPSGGGP
ncbi:MAG: exosortase/archaeosortase family protein [Deltaproteobacteria bacterium]|nr:MAG: exosortase/archaeosortase family protein [Deltaproteobacteria bacterium]